MPDTWELFLVCLACWFMSWLPLLSVTSRVGLGFIKDLLSNYMDYEIVNWEDHGSESLVIREKLPSDLFP